MVPQTKFLPCIPTRGTKVPDHPEWIHEVKHDGYRLIVERAGKRVRLFTRNGYDWSDWYPLIVEAALRNRASNFVLDGEAVLLGIDGVSHFDGLHSRKHDDEVQFYAFDMMVCDGDDIRKLPLSMRKGNLARMLARRVDGIFARLPLKPTSRHCRIELLGRSHLVRNDRAGGVPPLARRRR